MELLYYPISLCFIFFLFFLLKWSPIRQNRSTKKLPPGPWKLPIIGSIHHLVSSSPPHHTLTNLSRRYGPIMHLQLGEISAIVVSSPTTAKEVMKTHDLAFPARPQLLPTKVSLHDNQDIIFSPCGPYWRQMRKICHVELQGPKNAPSFASIREDEVNKVVESVKSTLGSRVNLTEKIYSMTGAIICRVAFGKRCEDHEELITLIREGGETVAAFDFSDLFPSLTMLHFLSGGKAKLLGLHRKLDVFLEGIVERHRENLASCGRGNGESGGEDLVDVLLRHQMNGDLQCPITINSIKAVIQDVLGAGTDTSSATVIWAMSEVMRNPKVMKKLQTELRHALKGKKTVNETDIKPLKYLKSVVKETLRLHPPLPFLPRVSAEQCDIDGYNIPINTEAIINVWAIGRDPEYWHDAESFIPERFDDDDDCSGLDYSGTKFQYIPFGAGRRICPGISLGAANVEFPLAQLFYQFDWKLADGLKQEDLDMTEKFGIAIGRCSDLYLVATNPPEFGC